MAQITLQEVVARADGFSAQGNKAGAIDEYQRSLSYEELAAVRHVIFFNLGVLLRELGQTDEAIQCYQQALRLKPDLYQASINLGLALESKGNRLDAVKSWLGALQPVDAQTTILNHLGRMMEGAHLLDDAEKYLLRSLVIDPEQPSAIQHYLYARQKQCKWPVVQELPFLSEDKQWQNCGPLALMALTDDPALQLQVIKGWGARHFKGEFAHLSVRKRYQHDKIRIGYMSCDFRWHAVSILTAELYEQHDRDRFEIYAIDYTQSNGDSMRERVLAAMDVHLPINQLSDEQAAQLIHEHEIDILVDLTGLTAGSRSSILKYRPAPIQVSYLGFVGTCGMDEIDYIIADHFVYPEALQAHFIEKPLYLPYVYQVNDSQRQIGVTPSRASCSLPEDAFVFCSFNGSYKITLEIFSYWMQILQQVPHGVLWLGADNQWARDNLKNQARLHGVDPNRLIYADKVPPADYLARYRVADLFLDTSPYNAGTTASDALWAGLPVLTCPGKTFAARMAGSLLNAIQMPDLIANSWQEYIDQAVFLATHQQEYQQLRQQVVENCKQSPLFDAPGFVRDLEAKFIEIQNQLPS